MANHLESEGLYQRPGFESITRQEGETLKAAGLNSSSSPAEIRAALEAAQAKDRSPETVNAAVDEFVRRVGLRGDVDMYTASEIAKHMEGKPMTADSLVQACEERIVQDMTQDQLRDYIRAVERQGGR